MHFIAYKYVKYYTLNAYVCCRKIKILKKPMPYRNNFS